jgi:hypothetical protein
MGSESRGSDGLERIVSMASERFEMALKLKRQAERIAELEAQLVGKWTSVKEYGYPTCSLGTPWSGLITDSRVVLRAEFRIVRYNSLTQEKEYEWVSLESSIDRIPFEVITHYQLLPAPPTKEASHAE